MTDHEPTDDAVLASAYLDGELDAADVARVERDPALSAEVDLHRQIRALVADVDAPSIARREEHLAAALDAWDRLPAAPRTADRTPVGVAGAITTPPPSLAERRAAGWNRRLLGAAAALVVVLGAGAALQVFTQIDDEQDDTAGLADDAADTDDVTVEVEAADGGDDAAADAAEAAPLAESDAAPVVDCTIDVASDKASPPRENDL